jgi:hypothetical protein
MKKFLILLILACLFISCRKENFEGESIFLKIEELRQTDTNIQVIDSQNETVLMVDPGRLIFPWEQGKSGEYIPTRLLRIELKAGKEAILVSTDGTFYYKLLIINGLKLDKVYGVNMVEIISARLTNNKTTLRIRYNNSLLGGSRVGDNEESFPL